LKGTNGCPHLDINLATLQVWYKTVLKIVSLRNNNERSKNVAGGFLKKFNDQEIERMFRNWKKWKKYYSVGDILLIPL